MMMIFVQLRVHNVIYFFTFWLWGFCWIWQTNPTPEFSFFLFQNTYCCLHMLITLPIPWKNSEIWLPGLKYLFFYFFEM